MRLLGLAALLMLACVPLVRAGCDCGGGCPGTAQSACGCGMCGMRTRSDPKGAQYQKMLRDTLDESERENDAAKAGGKSSSSSFEPMAKALPAAERRDFRKAVEAYVKENSPKGHWDMPSKKTGGVRVLNLKEIDETTIARAPGKLHSGSARFTEKGQSRLVEIVFTVDLSSKPGEVKKLKVLAARRR